MTWGTVVLLVLAFAGCGGDDKAGPPTQPKLPSELAAAFAYESDQIAASLAAGRECAAHRQAQALRAHVGDAVASGQVPPSLGREMSAGASSLGDGIVCEPAPAPAPEPEPKKKPAATPCEQLQAQVDQAKDQEKAAHGPDKQAAKELREQLEEQLKFQCEEHQGGGGDEGGGDASVPPGQAKKGGHGHGAD